MPMTQTADSDVVVVPTIGERGEASLLCFFCHGLRRIFFNSSDPVQSLPQMLLHVHYVAMDKATQCSAENLPEQVSVRIRPEGVDQGAERWILDRTTRKSWRVYD